MDYAASDIYDEVDGDIYDAPYELETAAFDTAAYGVFAVAVREVLAITCDNAHARLNAEYARKITRPYLPGMSADTAETTYEISFEDVIDTLVLANINFNSFKINIDGTEQTFTAVQNKATGRYDAICHLETDGANMMQIIITTQTPLDEASFFKLGAICGGVRVQINPWLPIKKKLKENVKTVTAEHGNPVTRRLGQPYHEIDLVFNYRGSDDMDDMHELEAAVDETGACIIYEYFSDRELIYLVERSGGVPYEQFAPGYEAAALKFVELN